MDTELAHVRDLSGVIATLGLNLGGPDGQGVRVGRLTPEKARAIRQAKAIFEACRRLPYGQFKIQEAFSTSDYPLAFSWYTDIRMLAAFQVWPRAWQRIFKRSLLPDFRYAARDRMQGLNAPMGIVPEGTDYPADRTLIGARLAGNDTSPANNQLLRVNKTGRWFGVSFESLVNDVLHQLDGIPAKLAEAAVRTEMLTASQAYVANSTLYGTHTLADSTTLVNKSTGKLTIANIIATITAMRKWRDDTGNPIYMGDYHLILVVPPDLEILAKQILGAQNFVFDADSSSKVHQYTTNYITPLLDLVVDPYIPVVDPTNGPTSWYVFTDAASAIAAGEVVFLQGHETPELFMKLPNAVRVTDTGVTGGLANPLDGAFENDSVAWKVRYPVGAGAYEFRATYWNDGTGS